jgi:FHA domain-containing protein
MKLTAVRRTDEEAFSPVQANFEAPGGTIGRGLENLLVLADQPGNLCRVQAMVRVHDTACYLVNLSSMSSVSVNGQALAREQEVVLRHGDEVAIGAYVLHADDANALAVAPAPAPDIFNDLMGPGTLPVGTAPDVSAHPFDMASAASRNPEDPLAHLDKGDMGFSNRPRDPLGMFSNPDNVHVHHVFSDSTPSTMHGHDPLAQLNDDPIASTLGRQDKAGAGTTGRDNVREQGGYMRPPTVRKDG